MKIIVAEGQVSLTSENKYELLQLIEVATGHEFNAPVFVESKKSTIGPRLYRKRRRTHICPIDKKEFRGKRGLAIHVRRAHHGFTTKGGQVIDRNTGGVVLNVKSHE